MSAQIEHGPLSTVLGDPAWEVAIEVDRGYRENGLGRALASPPVATWCRRTSSPRANLAGGSRSGGLVEV